MQSAAPEVTEHLGGEGKPDWPTAIKLFGEEMPYLCDTYHCLLFGVLCLGRVWCCAKAGTHSSVPWHMGAAVGHVPCSLVS